MICYYSDTHTQHRPPFEVFNGDHETAQEVPARANTIERALKTEGFMMRLGTRSVPSDILEAIHAPEYLRFLEDRCGSLATDDLYEFPSVHPFVALRGEARSVRSPIAQRGRFVFDTYTPLMRHTFLAAHAAASLAYEAAQELLIHPDGAYYALCRPPGHHAEPAMAGGYCYINNAAAAAETLSAHGKVAILDIDFHHGNGTQHIFYERSDVLTLSIHADPHEKFPFYSGFTDETGSGMGSHHNVNFPLSLGTDNAVYLETLQQALDRVALFAPDYFIIAYGADTHEKDPIGGFRLTTDFYTTIASMIRSCGIPTLIVQEGGYNNEYLGTNVTSFLKGFV